VCLLAGTAAILHHAATTTLLELTARHRQTRGVAALRHMHRFRRASSHGPYLSTCYACGFSLTKIAQNSQNGFLHPCGQNGYDPRKNTK